MASVPFSRQLLALGLVLALALAALVLPPQGAFAGGVNIEASTAKTVTGDPWLRFDPVEVDDGDLLIAVVSVRGRGEAVGYDGWDLVRTDRRANQVTQTLWTRRASADEPSSYAWTDGSTGTKSGALLVVSGGELGDGTSHTGAVSHQARDIVTPSATAREGGALLIGMFSMVASGDIRVPEQMTSMGVGIVDAISLSVATEAIGAGGTTGDRIATRAVSGGAVGQLLVIESQTSDGEDPAADEDSSEDEGDAGHEDGSDDESVPGDEGGSGGDGDDEDHEHESDEESEEGQAPDAAVVPVTGEQPSGFTVPEGEVWEIRGEVTSQRNVVVYGTLKMRSGSTLTFTDVDESAFVGPGDVSAPVAEDVGLWVFGSGKLDIVGSEKQGWNRTGTHETWSADDEYVSAPQELDDREPVPWSFGDDVPCLEFAGESYCTEIANLTRDVVIQGTESGQAHIYVRSDQPQTIRYAGLRFLGPNGDGPVDGRYPLHFHMMHEGSRGSLIEGVVVRDSDDHAFVPHHSDGMTFRDTVAYNVTNTAYWWDKGDATNDVRYERALALHVQSSDRESGSSLAGFRMGKGEGNVCVECVATGVRSGRSSSGFHWTAGDNYWGFIDSVAHNNHNGIYHWQNEPFAEDKAHQHSGFTAYRNSFRGIEQGAYTIQSFWNDTVSFGNDREGIVNRGHPKHGDLEPGIAYRGGKLGGGNGYSTISVTSNKFCRGQVLWEDLDLYPTNARAIRINVSSCPSGEILDHRFVNVTVEGEPLTEGDFQLDGLPPGGAVTVENSNGTSFRFEG